MFAGVGVIIVDCCSMEKEVMQKGWKKKCDFFIARIEGSGDRAAFGFCLCCSKNDMYRMQYLEFSNEREKTTTNKNVSFY
jgi:hypothetical protein